MSKALQGLIGSASTVWVRFNRFLSEKNDLQVAAWGSSLQYKRRYTNPDAAKRARQPL
ncbi:MAG TPA: hypothetical protein VD867_14850 [Burkholderiales bacterium]|nr:hypothetical protein [Burkholderiales bacterium]